jgi:hypothetical protein
MNQHPQSGQCDGEEISEPSRVVWKGIPGQKKGLGD